jgi:hypothetical protein
MNLPEERIDTQYVRFKGGLDLKTPVLSIDPGACLDAMNYQPGLFGGYERIEGFERSDGRAAPSEQVYYAMGLGWNTPPAPGLAIVGTTSGASAIVLGTEIDDTLDIVTVVILAKVVGTFLVGETVQTGGGGLPLLLTMTYPRNPSSGANYFEVTSAPVARGLGDNMRDAIYMNAAADIYRADVDKVPGSGPVRGVWLYRGIVYAFRDNADATAGGMWKQTSTGWAPVTLGHEISFIAGNDAVEDGDTLTQGATTATVARVVQSTTATSPNRVGRLILTGLTGSFAAGPATTTGGGALTLSGPSVQLSILPGGRYEFDNFNFSGSTDTRKMYGCDGVNRAFEYDGTNYIPISTGMAVDTPSYIRCHKNQLFLSFRGSSQNSGVGLPYIWTTVTGAGEIGIGDDITGYSILPGDALSIAGRNSLFQLIGSTVDDFVLKPISPDNGAIPRTVQKLGPTYLLDDQGVVVVTATQDYGNFSNRVVSRRAQPVIDSIRGKVVASSVYRTRSQYRLYANDGTGMVLAAGVDERGNPMIQITQFDYNAGRSTNLINVTCACAGEDTTGKDVVYLGADNGYVYQCEKGTSFDGEEIEAYLRLPFQNSKSPRVRKRYRKVVMEMEVAGYTTLRFHPEFSYGNPAIASHTLQTQAIVGTGAYWGSASATWSQFFYDAQIVSTPEFKINGSGTNVAMLFYSKSDYNAGHTLQGCIVHYSPRRLAR